MAELPTSLQSVVCDLELLEDRNLRMEYLIEAAERFEKVPPKVAIPPYPKERLVPGCESEVYVFVEKVGEGGVKLHFAVENPQGVSAKALGTILCEAFSGATLDQIESIPDEIVPRIFGSGISMGKGQGLINMLRVSKLLAGALELE